METLRDLALPPGFGFHPKDTELISHYLKKKISGQNIEFDVIPEVDIYKHEPWDLPAKCNLPIQDNKWHFFASRDRKYPNGSWSNRATIAGAQVVGWPPIRSYRKNTMATNQLKSSKEDADAKQGQGFLYVKVSMDGATYLRKVDLKTYKNYKDMSLALEKMFIGFSTGKDGVSENRKDGEYVLTYEDKDGDWMLVGDVPWE